MNFSNQQGKNPAENETILVVDDCNEALAIMEHCLNDAGYEPITCNSGQQALSIIKRESVDVVLMDMAMPGMDGVTAAEKIKKFVGNGLFLPIIMVSALNDEHEKVTSLQYADDYVTKPFSPDELIARIRTLLRIRILHRDLIRSRENYRHLYEYFPHLVVTLNTKMQIVDCNQTFCSCLGVDKATVIAQEMTAYICNQDRPHFQRFIAQLTEDRCSDCSQVFEMIVPDGQYLVVEIKAALIENDEGVEQLLLSMVNITEKKRLEEERRIARRQLYRSAKLASIGSLASGVAHEVNNPLTAILGFSSSILERIEQNEKVDPDELQRYLQIIAKETLRCRDIVENLSRFAKRDESVIAEVSLSNCVENTVKLINNRASKRGITFNNSLRHNLTVKTDPNKLEQVLLNIFSNCIDFCIPNSKVTISASAEYAQNGMVRMKIADQGPGIPSDIISRVFDPFFTTKDSVYGAGMGLAVCHRMMEDCSGKIDVFNDFQTGGTIVALEIPSSPESSSQDLL